MSDQIKDVSLKAHSTEAQEVDERAAFELWLRSKPEARLWNATDSMFAAYLAGRAALPATQQSPPEQVWQPYGWAVTGCHSLYRGDWAEATARSEAKRCGTARAFPLYARPASCVPEGWKLSVSESDGRKWLQIETPGGAKAALSTAEATIAAQVLDAFAEAQERQS